MPESNQILKTSLLPWNLWHKGSGFYDFFRAKSMIYSFFKRMGFLRCNGKKNLLFCANKVKFVLVIRTLLISFILLTAVNSKGQSNREPSLDVLQPILKVYPNPATTFTKFEFQKNFDQGYTLQVINFIGKQVYEAKNISSTTTLDLSSYNRGVYIYQLKDPSGKVVLSGKLQISK